VTVLGRRLQPSGILVLSFAGAILAGTLLLKLPAAAVQPLGWIDAFFTATSAVCVTGLIVVDTGSAFTPFGQVVILLLIQAGGLGIMTFAVFFSLLFGGRLSFQDRWVIQESLLYSPSTELRRLLGHVLVFTLTVEGIGALLLWSVFARDLGVWRGLYVSVFHAVSAFCNAGFSLFADNLMRYRGHAGVNFVITGLIIVGGLGFLVILELRDRLWALRSLEQRRGALRRPLSLHAKLVLAVTAGLLALGMVAFLALERHNLLSGLAWGERLQAAWFMTVTPRTAGFNTVDYGQATAATLFFTMLLMFIGASPGSTGGGVKTTTVGLLVALLHSRRRASPNVFAFGRTVPRGVVERALAVTLLAAALVAGVAVLLLVAEQGAVAYRAARQAALPLLFEAVSAFGTVGLSAGVTPTLSPAGRLLIVLLMFVGRVGPLTVALVASGVSGPRYRYAEESVMVG
jgi:trk system potassium uptake protein TrkH